MEKKILKLQETLYRKMPFLKTNKVTRKILELVVSANFFKYLVIGFSTLILQMILLNIICQVIGIEKQIANIFSTLLSMLFNYPMSNNWSFKAGSGKHKKKVSKYLFLAAFNYLFDVALAFPFLAVTLGINMYLSKIMITAIIVCWNFFLYKFWVFKKQDNI